MYVILNLTLAAFKCDLKVSRYIFYSVTTSFFDVD